MHRKIRRSIWVREGHLRPSRCRDIYWYHKNSFNLNWIILDSIQIIPIGDFNDHNLTTLKVISSAHIFIIYYIIYIYIAEWDFKRIRSRSGSFNGVILELNHNNFWRRFCPWPDLSKNDLFKWLVNELEFWIFQKMRKTVWIQRR